MELHDVPDVPPPPYSETDIYSTSHRTHDYNNHHNHGAGGNRNNSNTIVDDGFSVAPSSSYSNPIIYTPPESSESSPGSETHNTGLPSNVTPPPPSSSTTARTATASAQGYFATRSVSATINRGPNQARDTVTSYLSLTPDSTPSDFPYPADWAGRFDITAQDWLSFLNHALPTHVARANSAVVDRKSAAAASAKDGLSEWSLGDIDAAVSEWNEGFFKPRGVTILRSAGSPSTSSSSRRPPQPQQKQSQGQQPGRGQSNDAGSSWWRSALDLAAEIAAAPPQHRGHLGAQMLTERALGARGRGRGRDRGWSRGEWIDYTHDGNSHHRHHHHEHHHDPRPQAHHRRSSSRSSSSSSSSLSSSESSIGSLPDWDDLKDSQLPTAKDAVSQWLAHPEQPVTREALRRAKADIKAAKNNPSPNISGGSSNSRADDRAAREQLRREVKAMMQEFKALKRRQRDTKRAARRERKQRRRADKQERRQERRERRRRGGREGRRWREPSGSVDGFGGHHHHPHPPHHHEPMHPHQPPVTGVQSPAWGFGSFGGDGTGPFGGGGFGGRRGGRGGRGGPGVAGGITGFGFGNWGPRGMVNGPTISVPGVPRGGAPAAAPPSDETTAAMRTRIQTLEAQMRDKADEISSVAQKNAREVVEAAKRGDGETKTETKREAAALKRLEDLEKEMTDLSHEVDRLTVQADEEARSQSHGRSFGSGRRWRG